MGGCVFVIGNILLFSRVNQPIQGKNSLITERKPSLSKANLLLTAVWLIYFIFSYFYLLPAIGARSRFETLSGVHSNQLLTLFSDRSLAELLATFPRWP